MNFRFVDLPIKHTYTRQVLPAIARPGFVESCLLSASATLEATRSDLS